MSGREPTVGFAQSKPLAASDEVAQFLSDLSVACSAGDDVTLEIRHERSGKVISAGVVVSDNASVPLTVKQGFDLLELEPLFVGPDLRILSKEATFSNLLADGLAEDEQGRRAASTPRRPAGPTPGAPSGRRSARSVRAHHGHGDGYQSGGGGSTGGGEEVQIVSEGESVVSTTSIDVAVASLRGATPRGRSAKPKDPMPETSDELVALLTSVGLEAMCFPLRRVGIYSVGAFQLRSVSDIQDALRLPAGKGATFRLSQFDIKMLLKLGLERGEEEVDSLPTGKLNGGAAARQRAAVGLGTALGAFSSIDLAAVDDTAAKAGIGLPPLITKPPEIFAGCPFAFQLLGKVSEGEIHVPFLEKTFDALAECLVSSGGRVVPLEASPSRLDCIDAIDSVLQGGAARKLWSATSVKPKESGQRAAFKHVREMIMLSSPDVHEPSVADKPAAGAPLLGAEQLLSLSTMIGGKHLTESQLKVADEIQASRARALAVSSDDSSLLQIQQLGTAMNSSSAPQLKVSAFHDVCTNNVKIAELMMASNLLPPEGADAMNSRYVAAHNSRTAARNGILAAMKSLLKPALPHGADSRCLAEAALGGKMGTGGKTGFNLEALTKPGATQSWVSGTKAGAGRAEVHTESSLAINLLSAIPALIYALHIMQPTDPSALPTIVEVVGTFGRSLKKGTIGGGVESIIGFFLRAHEDAFDLFHKSTSVPIPSCAEVWAACQDEAELRIYLTNTCSPTSAPAPAPAHESGQDLSTLASSQQSIAKSVQALATKVAALSGDEGGAGSSGAAAKARQERNKEKRAKANAKAKEDKAELKKLKDAAAAAAPAAAAKK